MMENWMTDAASNELMDDPIEDSDEEVSEEMPEGMAEDMVEDMVDDIVENMPDDMPADMTEDPIEDATQVMPEDVPEGATQDISDDVIKSATQDISEDFIAGATQDMSEDVIKGSTQDLREDSPEVISDRLDSMSQDIPAHPDMLDVPVNMSDMPDGVLENTRGDTPDMHSDTPPLDTIPEDIPDMPGASDEDWSLSSVRSYQELGVYPSAEIDVFSLPLVTRIAKSGLSEENRATTKFRHEGLVAYARCASAFILYVTSAAVEIANRRKTAAMKRAGKRECPTLTAQDILKGLDDCGFEQISLQLISDDPSLTAPKRQKIGKK